MTCDCTHQKTLIHAIEEWFANSARPLPWRVRSSPWGRLVSEFMAQQTQITRVAQLWPELMERFPTPKSMASSSEQDVLSLWQGLGYYRRAKYLKQTAEMICEEFNEEIPSKIESLRKLPGVGQYTAGAISSIVFGNREPIVDGNVHRVLCRLFNHNDDQRSSPWTWNKAKLLVEESENPAIFNEGLMELGATVCTPKLPRCESCPLQKQCLAFKNNSQLEVPTPKSRAVKQQRFSYSVVMHHNDQLAFEKRSDSGLWAGMWQVPTVESSKELTELQVARKLNVQNKMFHLGQFEHILTHRVISFSVFSCQCKKESRFLWINRDDVGNLPLASAQRKVLAVHC